MHALLKNNDEDAQPTPFDPAKITYEQVISFLLPGEPASSPKVRSFRSLANNWCKWCGKGFKDLIGTDFGPSFEGRLSSLAEHLLTSKKSGGHADNVRSVAWQMHKAHQSLLADAGLPADFMDAIKVLCNRIGIFPHELAQRVSDLTAKKLGAKKMAVLNWFNGKHLPIDRRSINHIRLVEQALGVEEGALEKRALKTKELILNVQLKSSYRAHINTVCASEYIHPFPSHLELIFEEHAEWKTRKTFRINGKVYALRDEDCWLSEQGRFMRKQEFQRFFSFLMAPAPTVPAHKLTKEERMASGKGFQPEQLKYTMLVDDKLLWDYVQFRRERTHNDAFNRGHSGFIVTCVNLLSRPYSFIRANPRFAAEFDPPIPVEEWQTFCDARAKIMADTAKEIRNATSTTSSRQPGEVLAPVLALERPLQPIKEMIHRMREALPPSNRIAHRATKSRVVLLLELMTIEPLRLSHWGKIEIAKDFVRGENGQWTLTVEKKQFKNKSSRYCKDRKTTFNAEVSRHIDDYVKNERPNLPGGKDPNVHFLFLSLTKESGPAQVSLKGPNRYQWSDLAIQFAVSAAFKQYFGVTIFPHFMRHLIPTAYLKDNPGDWEGAAAILNNSPEMVRRHYGHIKQEDHLRRTNSWQDEQDKLFSQNRKEGRNG